jgi:hypothetical protein
MGRRRREEEDGEREREEVKGREPCRESSRTGSGW